jgi:hypothetical protein
MIIGGIIGGEMQSLKRCEKMSGQPCPSRMAGFPLSNAVKLPLPTFQAFSRFVLQKCLNLNSLPVRDNCDGAVFVGSENSCAQSFIPP